MLDVDLVQALPVSRCSCPLCKLWREKRPASYPRSWRRAARAQDRMETVTVVRHPSEDRLEEVMRPGQWGVSALLGWGGLAPALLTDGSSSTIPGSEDLGEPRRCPPCRCAMRGRTGQQRRCQVRLPEHGEESEGEAHRQGWTKVPQAGSDGAEAMEQGGGEDGKTP